MPSEIIQSCTVVWPKWRVGWICLWIRISRSLNGGWSWGYSYGLKFADWGRESLDSSLMGSMEFYFSSRKSGLIKCVTLFHFSRLLLKNRPSLHFGRHICVTSSTWKLWGNEFSKGSLNSPFHLVHFLGHSTVDFNFTVHHAALHFPRALLFPLKTPLHIHVGNPSVGLNRWNSQRPRKETYLNQ